MEELKPCPFCGGEARTENNDRTIYDPETFGFLDVEYGDPSCSWAGCRDCEAFVGGFDTEEEAIIAWNKRTPDISPGRLHEICKAEREGRVVVLPCKVGDTVYRNFGGKAYPVTVDRLILNRFTTPMFWIETKLNFASPHLDRVDLAIGKTVFLTREEAEAALKEDGIA